MQGTSQVHDERVHGGSPDEASACLRGLVCLVRLVCLVGLLRETKAGVYESLSRGILKMRQVFLMGYLLTLHDVFICGYLISVIYSFWNAYYLGESILDFYGY